MGVGRRVIAGRKGLGGEKGGEGGVAANTHNKDTKGHRTLKDTRRHYCGTKKHYFDTINIGHYFGTQ